MFTDLDIASHLPVVFTFDFTNCRHDHVIKREFARNGELVLRCMCCGRQFTEHMTNRLTSRYLRRIGQEWLKGTSAQECSVLINLHHSAVQGVYRRIPQLLASHPQFAGLLDLTNSYTQTRARLRGWEKRRERVRAAASASV
jgi:transposase-like protein